MGEEYIAHIAEKKTEYPGLWQDIINQVRKILRDLGIDISITDAEIEALIRKVEKNKAKAKQISTEEGNTSSSETVQTDETKKIDDLRKKGKVKKLYRGGYIDEDMTVDGGGNLGSGVYFTTSKEQAENFSKREEADNEFHEKEVIIENDATYGDTISIEDVKEIDEQLNLGLTEEDIEYLDNDGYVDFVDFYEGMVTPILQSLDISQEKVGQVIKDVTGFDSISSDYYGHRQYLVLSPKSQILKNNEQSETKTKEENQVSRETRTDKSNSGDVQTAEIQKIKSADNNIGTFSETTGDIRFQKSEKNTNLANNENKAQIPNGSAQEELRSGNETNSRMAKASAYIRGSLENAKGEGKITLHQKQDLEAKAAIEFAEKENVWINDISTLGSPFSSGHENNNYLDTDVTYVYKVNNLMNSNTIGKLFESIENHNKLFPETQYDFVGFTGNKNRLTSVHPIFRQKLVHNSVEAELNEIKAFMESLGFEQTTPESYVNKDYLVFDLYPRNVLKDPNGTMYVVL